MRAMKLLAIIAVAVLNPAFAATAVVTYIENDGRVIELCENKVDQFYGNEGSMMAVESREIITGESRQRIDVEDDILRWWKKDGDEWIVIYFKETKTEKRFHSSDVKMIIVDRPWYSNPTIPEYVDPV